MKASLLCLDFEPNTTKCSLVSNLAVTIAMRSVTKSGINYVHSVDPECNLIGLVSYQLQECQDCQQVQFTSHHNLKQCTHSSRCHNSHLYKCTCQDSLSNFSSHTFPGTLIIHNRCSISPCLEPMVIHCRAFHLQTMVFHSHTCSNSLLLRCSHK